MEEKLISIIIPVYNAEKYLKETIFSILVQDYKNFEVILVNDGSSDNSFELCLELSKLDHRVKVFDQENGGVSKARNKGLMEAKGDYIAFVDADDIIKEDMLSVLFNCAKKHNADIVSCGSAIVKNNKIIKEEYGTKVTRVYNKYEALEFFLSGNNVNIGVWTKLFRKELIRDIIFSEDKRINEDKLFIFDAIMKSEKFVLYDVTKYLYVIREESATTRAFDERWFDSLDIADQIENEIKCKEPELCFYAEVNKIKSYYWMLLKMYRTSGTIDSFPEQYDRIVHYLKRTNVFKMRKFITRNMVYQILLLKISEPVLRHIKMN